MFKKISQKKMFILTAVIGLLIFFYYVGLLKPVESAVNAVLNPVLSGFYSSGTHVQKGYNERKEKRNLEELARKQEAQIIKLTEENANLKILEEENDVLRKYLDFLPWRQNRYIMSNIISRGNITGQNRVEEITIDKGSRDGLYEGLGVVSSQGTIIGKVAEVKENISRIFLLNNKDCRLAASILGQDRTNGIVEGELGLTVKMRFIPQDVVVNPGDIVVTSGLERFIPRGLVIGRVKEVNKESNEMWQEVLIESIARFEDLAIVSIIFPGKEDN